MAGGLENLSAKIREVYTDGAKIVATPVNDRPVEETRNIEFDWMMANAGHHASGSIPFKAVNQNEQSFTLGA